MPNVRNDNGDSNLVYIKRLSENAPPTVPSWDYHFMASLPTNDNIRYSFDTNTDDRTFLSEYYWRLKTGPSDIKIQVGPYKSSDLPKTGIILVDIPSYRDSIYESGAYFFMPFDLDSTQKYIYCGYRKYQLGYEENTEWGTVGPDLNYIYATGDPTFEFRELNKEFGKIKTKKDFNSLPYLPVISGTPAVVPQTGTIVRTNLQYGEEKKQNYTLSYTPKIEYFIFKSRNTDMSTDNSQLKFGPQSWRSYPEDNTIEPVDFAKNETEFYPVGFVTQSRYGMKNQFGTANEKRLEVDVFIHKLPLHEISQWQYSESYGAKPESFPNAVTMDCKCTQLAYKVGSSWYSAPEERFNTDNSNFFDYQPGVLLFNRSPSHYKRLPECWPWSCRRYIVEKSVNPSSVPPNQKVVEYYSQDGSGNKTLINFDDIPTINLSLDSIIGSKSSSLYVMNDDPIYFPMPYYEAGKGTVSESPPSEKNYIDGYSCVRSEINMADLDDYIIEDICGCNLDDEKIELVGEVFPVLHNATCKLVLKTGFLCYATKSCNAPKPTRVTKKIVYPFNSCRFNEVLYSPAPKTDLPNIDLQIDAITFSPLRRAKIVYYKTNNAFKFMYPGFNENKVISSIEDGITITNTSDYSTVYLYFLIKQEIKYSTDIYVYKFTKNQIPEFYLKVSFDDTSNFDSENQEITGSDPGYLTKFNITGSATDDRLDEINNITGIITGGDYYIDSRTKEKIFWNPADEPRQEEFYYIDSIGNAEGFVNPSLQSTCCDFCVGEVSNTVQTNKNCYELDKEGTFDYIPRYTYAGQCDLDLRSPCAQEKIQLRSSLKVISTFVGENNPEFSLDCSGNIIADGIIRLQGASVLNVSGVVPSGEITSRVTGRSILAIESIMPPAEYIVNEL